MRLRILYAVACLAVCCIPPAAAQAPRPEASGRPSTEVPAGAEGIPSWASMCRANGAYFAEGQQACIRTSYGRRVAQCGKVLNVLNWEVSASSCPEP